MAKDINIFKFDDNFIAYKEHKSKRKNSPTVVFHHGLMSDLTGKKSEYLYNYAIEHDINFVCFDNFGHGRSSGKFTEQTIGNWVFGLKQILDKVIKGDFILVGSSMGGWISLISSKFYNERLKGMLLIAPAPDFTEDLIWGKMTKLQQEHMIKHGVIEFGLHTCKYPIAYNLISEARNHLILKNEKLNYNCPVHIIQGKQDEDVPYNTALKLMDIIQAPCATLKLLKDSKHNLSSEIELQMIITSLKEILSYSSI